MSLTQRKAKPREHSSRPTPAASRPGAGDGESTASGISSTRSSTGCGDVEDSLQELGAGVWATGWTMYTALGIAATRAMSAGTLRSGLASEPIGKPDSRIARRMTRNAAIGTGRPTRNRCRPPRGRASACRAAGAGPAHLADQHRPGRPEEGPRRSRRVPRLQVVAAGERCQGAEGGGPAILITEAGAEVRGQRLRGGQDLGERASPAGPYNAPSSSEQAQNACLGRVAVAVLDAPLPPRQPRRRASGPPRTDFSRPRKMLRPEPSRASSASTCSALMAPSKMPSLRQCASAAERAIVSPTNGAMTSTITFTASLGVMSGRR